MKKFTDKIQNLIESGVLPGVTIALAVLSWWFGLLRQFLIGYLIIGFATFVVVMIWMYWEDRPEVSLVHKVALTAGWLYLFITVNLLMRREPVDTGGWEYPSYAVGAIIIAIFYPFVWLYRLFFG